MSVRCRCRVWGFGEGSMKTTERRKEQNTLEKCCMRPRTVYSTSLREAACARRDHFEREGGREWEGGGCACCSILPPSLPGLTSRGVPRFETLHQSPTYRPEKLYIHWQTQEVVHWPCSAVSMSTFFLFLGEGGGVIGWGSSIKCLQSYNASCKSPVVTQHVTKNRWVIKWAGPPPKSIRPSRACSSLEAWWSRPDRGEIIQERRSYWGHGSLGRDDEETVLQAKKTTNINGDNLNCM